MSSEAIAFNYFAEPLPGQEVKHIARSVAQWTWRHFGPVTQAEYIKETHTSEAQRARVGKRWEKRTPRRGRRRSVHGERN